MSVQKYHIVYNLLTTHLERGKCNNLINAGQQQQRGKRNMTMMGRSKHDLRPQIAWWLVLFRGYSELACSYVCFQFHHERTETCFPQQPQSIGWGIVLSLQIIQKQISAPNCFVWTCPDTVSVKQRRPESESTCPVNLPLRNKLEILMQM